MASEGGAGIRAYENRYDARMRGQHQASLLSGIPRAPSLGQASRYKDESVASCVAIDKTNLMARLGCIHLSWYKSSSDLKEGTVCSVLFGPSVPLNQYRYTQNDLIHTSEFFDPL